MPKTEEQLTEEIEDRIEEYHLHLPGGTKVLKPISKGGTVDVKSTGNVGGVLVLREIFEDGSELQHYGMGHSIKWAPPRLIEGATRMPPPPKRGH